MRMIQLFMTAAEITHVPHFFFPFESERSLRRADLNYREGLAVLTELPHFETQFYFCTSSIWTRSSENTPSEL